MRASHYIALDGAARDNMRRALAADSPARLALRWSDGLGGYIHPEPPLVFAFRASQERLASTNDGRRAELASPQDYRTLLSSNPKATDKGSVVAMDRGRAGRENRGERMARIRWPLYPLTSATQFALRLRHLRHATLLLSDALIRFFLSTPRPRVLRTRSRSILDRAQEGRTRAFAPPSTVYEGYSDMYTRAEAEDARRERT